MKNIAYKRVKFTEEMKKDYTILVPNMLPIQFKLIISILQNYGYNLELLESQGNNIIEQGLKNVHNDTCYPALLVIGQLIDAIESGKYDKHKIALMITQTGGGCRASNYIHLLRKALHKAGYDYIPVISVNFTGLEDNPGFKITTKMLIQLGYCILLGDFIMMIYNQCRPYEINKGDSDTAVNDCINMISEEFKRNKLIRYCKVKKLYNVILSRFTEVKCNKVMEKVKVGIVGEIYVKFSPLGNNNLEAFLLSENTETVLPGLMDFCLYCIYNSVIDFKLYKRNPFKALQSRIIYDFILKKQKDVINIIKQNGNFRAPQFFENIRKRVSKIIGEGVKMGEGWLLPAEMIELISEGVNNIVCTQPFGCLPNHIAGKGMIRKIKELYPESNIVCIDYDPGASHINQENRIKLMLSSAT